ncbi:MAG: transglycosylase [Nocardia sp.]|nr:transglycosylase [Nocardia sp.]
MDPADPAGYGQLVAGGEFNHYMVSPNGLYSVFAVPGPPSSNDSSTAYEIVGPDGQQLATRQLPQVGATGHIDIGNDGVLTEYATAGTSKSVQTIAPLTPKPSPGECTIVNSPKAPAAVRAAIDDAQKVTQNILGQFGSKKPQVVNPYPLTTSNVFALDKSSGATADQYNAAVKALIDQASKWSDVNDKQAIEASAKMVGANNKYYNDIVDTITNLNIQLRTLISPNPDKFDATNTDSILVSVATAMDTVQQKYQGYMTEVADAAQTIVVRRGDNLSEIAAKYGQTWQQLYARNRQIVGTDPNLIQPGQKLTIKPAKSAGDGNGAKASGTQINEVATGTPKAKPLTVVKPPAKSAGNGNGAKASGAQINEVATGTPKAKPPTVVKPPPKTDARTPWSAGGVQLRTT